MDGEEEFTQKYTIASSLLKSGEVLAFSSFLYVAHTHSLINGKDRSIYKPQRSHPPILPWISTHIQSLPPMSPFPSSNSHTIKEQTKTPTIRSPRASSSFTLLSGSSTFFPADASIQNLSALPQPQRIPGNHANQETAIMRAYRAASHDFQQLLTCGEG